MADWRKLSQQFVLADGVIDDNEVKILKKELWADDQIDQDELDYMLELRAAAQKRAKARGEALKPAFEKLFADVIEKAVLTPEGGIAADKVSWLRQTFFSGKKIEDSARKLLTRLKKGLKQDSAAFNALHDEHGEKKAPAPKK